MLTIYQKHLCSALLILLMMLVYLFQAEIVQNSKKSF